MDKPNDDQKLSSQRVQTSLLAGPEKRVLIWMAERLPAWVGPDLLTFIGLVAMAAIGACYLFGTRHYGFLVGASVGLFVNWFGDSLDGTVARVRKMQRPKFGYYLDHLVDAFGTAFLLLGLAYSGMMTPILGVAALVVYLIMSINVYLATHTMGEFKISFAGVSPTEGRVLLIILNTVLIFVKKVTIGSTDVWILDATAVAATILLLVIVLKDAYGNLSRLDAAERAAWTKPDEDAE